MASAPINNTARPFASIRPATPPSLPPRPVEPGLKHHKSPPLPAHRPAPPIANLPPIPPLTSSQTQTQVQPLAGVNGRTISSSVTGPIALQVRDNPVTITSTGKVTSTGTGNDGIDGPSGTTWTITNAGTVTSAAAYGIRLAGQGTISSSGLMSGRGGVALGAGGSVTNAAGGSIVATGSVGGGLSVGAGIYVTGASGTVANYGSISAGAYGVGLGHGGSVTNVSVISGGEDGIIIQGGQGTIVNSGRVTASVDDGVAEFSGGSVQNKAGASIAGGGSRRLLYRRFRHIDQCRRNYRTAPGRPPVGWRQCHKRRRRVHNRQHCRDRVQ
jgi:hypothetical protein